MIFAWIGNFYQFSMCVRIYPHKFETPIIHWNTFTISQSFSDCVKTEVWNSNNTAFVSQYYIDIIISILSQYYIKVIISILSPPALVHPSIFLFSKDESESAALEKYWEWNVFLRFWIKNENIWLNIRIWEWVFWGQHLFSHLHRSSAFVLTRHHSLASRDYCSWTSKLLLRIYQWYATCCIFPGPHQVLIQVGW